ACAIQPWATPHRGLQPSGAPSGAVCRFWFAWTSESLASLFPSVLRLVIFALSIVRPLLSHCSGEIEALPILRDQDDHRGRKRGYELALIAAAANPRRRPPPVAASRSQAPSLPASEFDGAGDENSRFGSGRTQRFRNPFSCLQQSCGYRCQLAKRPRQAA